MRRSLAGRALKEPRPVCYDLCPSLIVIGQPTLALCGYPLRFTECSVPPDKLLLERFRGIAAIVGIDGGEGLRKPLLVLPVLAKLIVVRLHGPRLGAPTRGKDAIARYLRPVQQRGQSKDEAPDFGVGFAKFETQV